MTKVENEVENRDEAPLRSFGFLLIDRFSSMCLTSAVEPLRVANRLLGRSVYRWSFGSVDGLQVEASNGIAIAVNWTLSEVPPVDVFFVCAGLDVLPEPASRYNAALRRVARSTPIVGALSAGTFLLARAGLLDDHMCTVHWENRPAFEEGFPDLHCTGNIFQIDRNRWTCSGGIASMDLMLWMIEEDFGVVFAGEIANQFQLDRRRATDDLQRPGSLLRLTNLPAKLRVSIEIMNENIEEPIPTSRIAREVGLSVRQVERLYLKYLGCSPAKYYLRLRLERARELILHTSKPLIDVALATGFASNSYFAHCYRNHFGQNPSAVRKLVH